MKRITIIIFAVMTVLLANATDYRPNSYNSGEFAALSEGEQFSYLFKIGTTNASQYYNIDLQETRALLDSLSQVCIDLDYNTFSKRLPFWRLLGSYYMNGRYVDTDFQRVVDMYEKVWTNFDEKNADITLDMAIAYHRLALTYRDYEINEDVDDAIDAFTNYYIYSSDVAAIDSLRDIRRQWPDHLNTLPDIYSKYDKIMRIVYTEDLDESYYIVRNNGLYGVVNISGREIIPTVYDSYRFDSLDFDDKLIFMRKGDAEYLFHTDGRQLLDKPITSLTNIEITGENNLVIVDDFTIEKPYIYYIYCQDDKYGVIDSESYNVITEAKYDDIVQIVRDRDNNSQLVIIAEKNGLTGAERTDGSIVAEYKYTDIFPIYDNRGNTTGLKLLLPSGKWQIMKLDAKQYPKAEWDNVMGLFEDFPISDIDTDHFIVSEGNARYIIDWNGKKLTPNGVDRIKVTDSPYIILHNAKNGKLAIADLTRNFSLVTKFCIDAPENYDDTIIPLIGYKGKSYYILDSIDEKHIRVLPYNDDNLFIHILTIDKKDKISITPTNEKFGFNPE